MTTPKFSNASTAFKAVYGDGSLGHVGNFLGGKVKKNIDAGIFENACAIRMSYVLNQVGLSVYSSSLWSTVSGKGGNLYIFRVKDLLTFLQQKLGTATEWAQPGSKQLGGHKGILVFKVDGWSNATGHATLWNGSGCLDQCYFTQSRLAHFWTLT